MNDTQLSSKYTADKDMALSHLNLQNYHPTLLENAYKGKFMMNNNDGKQPESSLGALHPNIFALNSISNQYVKGIDLASLHESLNRAQTTLEESQNIRVKHLFSMTNNESAAAKAFVENQNAPKNHSAANVNSQTNDRNNNKSTASKEKNDAPSQFKDFEPPAEKSNQSLHTNAKSGVSLKCAYCEAREDFKSRYVDVIVLGQLGLNSSLDCLITEKVSM